MEGEKPTLKKVKRSRQKKWPRVSNSINWNVCSNIRGNKEMYQRKIIGGIVVVQLVIFDCSIANASHWEGGNFNHIPL